MRRLAIIPVAVLLSSASAATPQRLTIGLDRPARLPLSGPALNVIVGDPAVVDVLVSSSSHTVLVYGKTYGRTEVIALGAGGRPVWQGEVAVSAAASPRVDVHRGQQMTDYACVTSTPCSPIIFTQA
jgi:Flp pilus assembly secretin CpaC